VRGFKRRFWQASEDHRGVPGAPGRVVTIVPSDTLLDNDHHGATNHTVGVAFLVEPEQRKQVLEYLDFREKGGYSTTFVDVYADDNADTPLIRGAMLYTGTTDNEMFVGPGSCLDEIADIIAKRVGPSGANAEYLLNLAEALRRRGVHDQHVFDLEERVLSIVEQAKNADEQLDDRKQPENENNKKQH
jgi:cation transport protein ChaC